ncbi:MAG TPA: hypothetical protein VF421_10800 [Niabella sp.]
MKKQLLLMAFACGIAAAGYAQQDLAKTSFKPVLSLKETDARSPFQLQHTAVTNFRMAQSPERWQRLRRAGIVLTSVGVASIAGGITLVAVGNNDNNRSYNYDYSNDVTSGDQKIAFGVLGIAGGITALGGGITMWAIGNHRLRKYADRVHIDVGGNAARIAYKF